MSTLKRAGNALTSQDQIDIRRDIGLPLPTSGDAATGQVVTGNDSRLTDARTPSGAAIAAATSKTTPVDADSLPISDSAASGGLKRLTWANVKAALKTYFDSLYVSLTGIKTINGQTLIGSGDLTVGGGSGATNLSYTASPTNGIVVSDTGTDATVPLSDGTNAGLMAPAQHAKLAGIGAGANVTSVAGKTGVVTLAAADVGDSTVAGRALLTAADAAAQRSSLGLGTAATSAASAFAASGAITGSGLTQATARLIGRTTAGAGAPEEITVGSGLSLSAGTLSATGGGSGTVTSVNLTPPAAGITVSGGPITSSGSITLALANDLAAVEGLSATGIVRRTAADTWSAGTAVALGSEVSGTLPVANGGTGTATPSLVAGTNITVTGTWPNQTIAASGGGGSPGGSTTQLQFNNAGAFGGASGLTTTGTELTIASGTKTTSTPALDITQTLNSAGTTFTAARINVTDTASAAGSQLFALQVGGFNQFAVTKGGVLRTAAFGSASTAALQIGYGGSAGFTFDTGLGNTNGNELNIICSGTGIAQFQQSTRLMVMPAASFIGWSSAGSLAAGMTADTAWTRDSAGVIAATSGAAATYRDVKLRNLIATQVVQTTALTVATLPAAASWPGGRAYVTDASSPTVGSTVAGGGSARAEVMSNGTNWIVTAVV